MTTIDDVDGQLVDQVNRLLRSGSAFTAGAVAWAILSVVGGAVLAFQSSTDTDGFTSYPDVAVGVAAALGGLLTAALLLGLGRLLTALGVFAAAWNDDRILEP